MGGIEKNKKRREQWALLPREECLLCMKSVSAGYLKTHIDRCHPVDGSKYDSAPCPHCGKSYGRLYMKHHIAKRHPLLEPIGEHLE
jgi:hypothetical protein